MSDSELKADVILDASGFVCPLPAVKTALALEKMGQDEVLEVLTTDEVSRTDLPKWCEETGNKLLQINDRGSTMHIFIRKCG